jgi:hypothetical protein
MAVFVATCVLSLGCGDDTFDPADYTPPEWAPDPIAQRRLDAVAPFEPAELVSSFTSNESTTAISADLYQTIASQDAVRRHYASAFSVPGWKLLAEVTGPVWEEAVAAWEHEIRGHVSLRWGFTEESLEIILQADLEEPTTPNRHTLALLWSEGCNKGSAQPSNSDGGSETNCFIVEAYDYKFISWP